MSGMSARRIARPTANTQRPALHVINAFPTNSILARIKRTTGAMIDWRRKYDLLEYAGHFRRGAVLRFGLSSPRAEAMTDIALHPHADVGWVSWRFGGNFGRIHLTRPGSERTLCGPPIPTAWFARVVRNQETAALEDICLGCLKEYATNRVRPHDAA